MIVAYIDAYKASFGVEPICRVLRDHDYQIAPSTYYAFKKRPPSARSLSDERLLAEVRCVFYANYECYGVRKVWQELRRRRVAAGRDQVARIMRSAGLRGATRLKRVRTTYPEVGAARAPDLVQRNWSLEAPDTVWVSDFTYVPSREGAVYVSFSCRTCSPGASWASRWPPAWARSSLPRRWIKPSASGSARTPASPGRAS